MSWEQVALKKREQLKLQIPSEWVLESIPTADEEPNAYLYLNKILPQDVVEITNMTAIELLQKIAAGELTSYSVTKAFCHRAAMGQQLINFLTEIFFDKALEDAKKLDQFFIENDGKTVGPLHGLPISLKDQVNLHGIDTSIGYTALFINDELQKQITGRNKHDKRDSLIAQILRNAGAIFYIKTTVPMAMMASDTTTGLFGTTTNAINRNFSPGGSSGGEGALIASHSALVGLGTDIGGSIRIPSSFNGLFGLRPSSNRLPYLNVANSMANQPIVPSVIGPIATDLKDLELITKTIIDAEPWKFDTKVPPITWRKFDTNNNKKFNFGVLETDNFVTPHPAFKRALEIVSKALVIQDHDVFKFQPPVEHSEIVDLLSQIFVSDSMEEIRKNAALSGEPVGQVVSELLTPPAKNYSVTDHWGQLKLKYEYQQKYNEGWLKTQEETQNGEPMDAFIAPSWSSTSFKIGRHSKSPTTYTGFLNILDYSVCIIPITTVDKDIDLYPKDYVPINETDAMNYHEYDPETYHGLPVCIQLIARKYEEEKVLALAQVILDSLKHT